MNKIYKTNAVRNSLERKQKTTLHFMLGFFMFFAFCGLQAQTTLINPATEGGFNSGSTFAANGWTVANEGTGPIKWALGTAASGITASGATTSGSATFTLAAANPSIMAGQFAYGFNIPTNTFVVSVSGTTVTLSQNATTTATNVVLGFSAFPGSVNVNATQSTSATVALASYTITLAAANPNIAAGMLITPSSIIDAGTYVVSVSGTSLRISKPTLAAATTAQTLNFTANGSSITGNAAYITNDNGVTNSYGGNATNRTLYLYRDITTAPASEKAMTLSFDVKSPVNTTSAGWQVWVAPITQNVTGTNTQVTTPGNYGVNWPGATMIAFGAEPQVSATKMTAFIPKSFAGTSFRLIFVWTNAASSGTLPPVAIDNISLTSRVSDEITAAQSGLWSMASTWDGGKVPTHADTVVLDGAESVIVDARYTGCEDLILAGDNALLQFGFSTPVDEFTIYNDLNVAASGARFNNHDGTNGKNIKLGHNLDVGVGGRFDSSLGSAAFHGRLTLNGSTVQNITVNPAGFFGGSLIQSQTAASTAANQIGVLNQLEINNTATAASNVVWNVPLTRIKSNLIFTNARVNVTTGNRFVFGNFGSMLGSNFICNSGSGFTNGLISRWLVGSDNYTVNPGTEYPGLHNNGNVYRYPFLSPTGADRTFYVLPDGNASPAGEIAVLYTHSNTVTPSLSIADGSYTINNRFEGNYTVSTPNASATPIAITYVPNASTPTFRIGAYLNGAFEALDGSTRFMNQTAALAGTHQDGTNRPFVFRKGLSLTDLTTAPIYVGIKSSSTVDISTAIVSAGSGDWNTAATWVGGVVPGCTNSVSIASGHTVTVTSSANAANLVIATGGTLVNNSTTNNMTVGCTNNNAAFSNYGTHTMTSGKLFVNGFVVHKAGSFFNQTGGEIIVDSNNNGDTATSVAFGGTSFKIETSNLNLTDGKITIVDPLVNIETTPITATSIANFSLNTQGSAGVFVKTTTNVLSTNSFTTSNSGGNMIAVGQVVSGHANIPAGTTVLSTSVNFAGTVNTVTLSQNVTGSIPSGTDLNFSSMLNGNTSIVIENAAGNANLAVGQVVSGNGIQTGTTIASIAAEFGGPARVRIVLSLPVLGLATSPITAPVTLSFSAVNVGSPVTVLTAANPSIQIGMPVTGTGILPGTIVANIEGTVLTLSEPVQAGAPSPLVMSFYTFFTQSSGSFIYASPNHYATGLNHTLQIGDGVSTQNTSIVTNGFSCQFQAGGGLLSLGNLTVDAPNGAERFMNVSSNNVNSGTVPAGYNFNVQNN
uniref:beta strand repeat-containing protein n=1 Tax=Flavobacterium sp. TaxID=239 RepID=UPI0037C067CA